MHAGVQKTRQNKRTYQTQHDEETKHEEIVNNELRFAYGALKVLKEPPPFSNWALIHAW